MGEYIAKVLRKNGPFSYTELYFQHPWRDQRILDEYILPCFEENNGKGFLFRATRSQARPVPYPFIEYGGQAWIILHSAFAKWLSKCLFDPDDHSHPFWDSEAC